MDSLGFQEHETPIHPTIYYCHTSVESYSSLFVLFVKMYECKSAEWFFFLWCVVVGCVQSVMINLGT